MGRSKHRQHRGAPARPQNVARAPSSAATAVVTVDLSAEPESWPSVSLCMIVRNEEAHLADCLRSVGDLACETIIVDTGSTDGTVEIARSFGAEVRHFPWVNDFAAARNESIRGAKGDWIFWMDADDRIAPEQLRAVKALLATAQADVYVMRVGGRIRGGDSMGGTLHSRLFHNGLGLHFVGRIHERLEGLVGRAPRMARTPIAIEHTGYDTTAEVLRAKATRNRDILRQCLAEEPDNLYWHYHMGVVAFMLEDWAEVADRLAPVLAEPPSSLHRDSELMEAHWLLAAALTRLGRLDRAAEVLDEAMARYPDRRQIWATAGAFYLDSDQPAKAAAALERGLSLPADDLGTSRKPEELLLMLSRAHMLSGDRERAGRAYHDWLAAAGHPNSPADPVRLGEARRLLFEGRPMEAHAALAPTAAADPAALRLLSDIAVSAQAWDRAADYRTRAICLEGAQSEEWAALAGLYLKTGNHAAARRLCDLALAGETPSAAAANLRGALAALEGDGLTAQRWLVQALLADRGHRPALDNLAALGISYESALRAEGLARLRAADGAGAARVFAAAIDEWPRSVEGYQGLAAALRLLGREDDALLCWQTAQRLAQPGQAG
ncbi:MAG: glycosyltransferase [Anaerolineae bacterium]